MEILLSDPDKIKKMLREAVSEYAVFAFSGSGKSESGRITRAEISLEEQTIPQWLSAQTSNRKIYWQDREKKFEVAGIGIAHEITSRSGSDYENIFKGIREILRNSDQGVRYFGGSRFRCPDGEGDEWQQFGTARFFVPRFELIRENGKTRIAVNFYLVTDDKIDKQLEIVIQGIMNLEFNLPQAQFNIPGYLGRTDIPDKEKWISDINRAIKKIKTGGMQKIVLSRKSILKFEKDFDPLHLLPLLEERQTPVYEFYYQLAERTAFWGATPERLFKRQHKLIYSEALAGTCPRGVNFQEDKELETRLLQSKKDLAEHRWVSNIVFRNLRELCQSSEIMEVETVLKLTYVQHLLTNFCGKLKPEIFDETILHKLHPTPAVCGFPREEALKNISQFEPFDRGWYSGLVGWVNREGADFAVAIRSALLNDDVLILYAGAGIVGDSCPEREWEELESKILNFMILFKQE